MRIKKDNIPLDRHFPLNVFDSMMPPGYNMDEVHHWHDCLEISYVISGRGRYHIEGRTCEMEPGDVIILNNVEPHYLEVDGEEMRQPVLIFEPSLVWSDCSNTMDYDYLRPFFERGSDFSNKLDPSHPVTPKIKENLLLIREEFEEKPEGYRLMIKARLLVILTYLIRHFRDTARTELVNKRQDLLRMEEVLRFVAENYREEIMLEDAAARLHVTPQYFSSLFKRLTGKTFIEYLNSIRIKHAIRMIRETNQKITRIAMECGFNNLANFNSIFKKHTGKVPSDFRE